ncbi:MAG TPA: contact-dependent growth inhibition system immunity protein [Myxococcota bacterium]|nr:contact-dependent growth inhibition system immunity protein [Myxococcota bacterium]
MSRKPTFIVVNDENRSHLGRFAGWFHQDFSHLGGDFDEGGRDYLKTLSTPEVDALRRELAAFIREHGDRRRAQLRAAWIPQGAGSAPRDLQVWLERTLKAMQRAAKE